MRGPVFTFGWALGFGGSEGKTVEEFTESLYGVSRGGPRLTLVFGFPSRGTQGRPFSTFLGVKGFKGGSAYTLVWERVFGEVSATFWPGVKGAFNLLK